MTPTTLHCSWDDFVKWLELFCWLAQSNHVIICSINRRLRLNGTRWGKPAKIHCSYICFISYFACTLHFPSKCQVLPRKNEPEVTALHSIAGACQNSNLQHLRSFSSGHLQTLQWKMKRWHLPPPHANKRRSVAMEIWLDSPKHLQFKHC